MAEKKKNGAPYGNKNAVGSRGGRPAKGNQNATKHGLYAKYIPANVIELMDDTPKNMADVLLEQIKLLRARIIRAQEYMDAEGVPDGGIGPTARAMDSLNKLITQYEQMVPTTQEHADDGFTDAVKNSAAEVWK